MQKLRVALLAAATVGGAVLFYSSGAAQADVTATSGRAFGVQATLLNIALVQPTPDTGQQGPAIGYPLVAPGTVNVGLPGAACPLFPVAAPTNVPLTNILDVCGIDVSTFGTVGATPHLNAANSTATIAGVAVGTGPGGLIALNAVTEACVANGNSATATLNIANGTLGGATSPLLTGNISPNTAITVPGTAAVILNAQVPTTVVPTGGGIGTNGIVAEAVRITLLDNTVIVLGHVECLATGPDVNLVTTTSSSTSSSSSSSTSSTSSTSSSTTSTTTVGTSTTSTTAPGTSTTSTTAGTGTTTTTAPGTSTTSTSTPNGGGPNSLTIISACNGGPGGNSGSAQNGNGDQNALVVGSGTIGQTGPTNKATTGDGGAGGGACNGGGVAGLGSTPTGTIPGSATLTGTNLISFCNGGNGGNSGPVLNSNGAQSGAVIAGGSITQTGANNTGTSGAGGAGGPACNFTVNNINGGGGGGGGGAGGGGGGGAGGSGGAGGAGGSGGAGGAGGSGGSGGAGGAGGQPGAAGLPGTAGVAAFQTSTLARTGAQIGPSLMMAIALTVLGGLLFLGSQGLPDQTFRAFTTHPAFRPAYATGGGRAAPVGASSRLDGAALDALAGMQGHGPPSADPDVAGPPTGSHSGRKPASRWFSQRPW